MSAKKPKIRSDLKEKEKSNDKIESSQSSNKPKEVEQDKEVEILDEPKKVESPKETRYELRGKCFSCNEIGHMKRDCTNKSFNHVKDFYCHNFVMVWVIKKLIIGNLNMIMIEGIVECMEILTL